MKTNRKPNNRPRPFRTINHAMVWFQVWAEGAEHSQLIPILASRFPTAESLRSTNHVVQGSANELMQEIHCDVLARFHEATDNAYLDVEESIHIQTVTFHAPKTGKWKAPRFDRKLEEGRKEFRDTGLTWEPKGHWEPGVDAAGVERLVWVNDEGVTILPIPQDGRGRKAVA